MKECLSFQLCRFKNIAVLRRTGIPKAENKGQASLPSASADVSEEFGAGLLARAALFRLEAETLRERASATGEPVIRNQYFQLADRWLMLAAGLEAETFAGLTP